ncbi:hypothetical protein EA251_23710 [Escherichia coli]|nr:hypothetical protein EA251_23710 [Escherichia coli]RRO51153.1 hypothetical protein AWG78_017100 [Escherichia coli]
MSHIRPDFPEPYELPVDGLRGKKCFFSHPVYLFLREFSLQDSRGGSIRPSINRQGWYPNAINQTVNRNRSGR